MDAEQIKRIRARLMSEIASLDRVVANAQELGLGHGWVDTQRDDWRALVSMLDDPRADLESARADLAALQARYDEECSETRPAVQVGPDGIMRSLACAGCDDLRVDLARVTSERDEARSTISDLLPGMDADALTIAQLRRERDEARRYRDAAIERAEQAERERDAFKTCLGEASTSYALLRHELECAERERDARPSITPEDAERFDRYENGLYTSGLDRDAAQRVRAALREHAKRANGDE